jgi:transposase InsO family protein
VNLSKRQARWAESLAEFDLEIRYKEGRSNVVADALSRQVAVLRHEHTFVCAISQLSAPNFVDRIRAALPTDELYNSMKTRLQAPDALPEPFVFSTPRADSPALLYLFHPSGFSLYVPAVADLRATILREYHDAAGHLSANKFLDNVRRSYWWPGLRKDVSDYVLSCDACQRNKPTNTRPMGLARMLPIPDAPWETVTMDFVVQLPRTRSGNTAIFVCVDKFSKMIHLSPTTDRITAPRTARLFFDSVIRLHGWPKTIIHDRDTRFTSDFWSSLFRIVETKISPSTAYHPQTDGQTERANRTIIEMLRPYVNQYHTDWDEHLPTVEFAYNNSVNMSHGFTPFYLNYARHPLIPACFGSPLPTASVPRPVSTFLSDIALAYTTARARLHAAQSAQAKYIDATRRPSTITPGCEVLLSLANTAYRTGSNLAHKLLPLWAGPFKVLGFAHNNPNAVRLDLPSTWRNIHAVVNISRLRLYNTSDPSRFGTRDIIDRPSPSELLPDGSLIHEVLDILDRKVEHRGKRRFVSYLVRWRGLPASENSWEPLSNLSGRYAGPEVLQMVQSYDASHPFD